MIDIVGALRDLLARLTSARAAKLDNLDAAISTRSTLTQAQILSDSTPFAGVNIASILSGLTDIKGTGWRTGNDTLAYIGRIAESANGSIVADAGNTASTFKTSLTSAVDDFYKGSLIMFNNVTDSLFGQTRRITAYSGTTNFVTVSRPLTSVPSTGFFFQIIPTDLYLNDIAAADVWSYATRTITSPVFGNLVTKNLADILSDTTPFAGANIASIKAKTDLIPADITTQLDTNIPAIKTQTDKMPRIASSMDFWGVVVKQLQLTATLQSNLALTGADVTIAGIPAGATIIRVVVMFMCRAIENTNAAANSLSGAQNIQVNFGGGAFASAIALATTLFGVAASTREMGTVAVGATDVKATVTGNGTCTFRIDAALAAQNNLNFNDYQVGVRVFFTV